jgi:membrane fusion protein (multidrug efflux system)
MDGDLRPRFRRLPANETLGQGWSYSSPIEAETGYTQPVLPRSDFPRRDPAAPPYRTDEPRRNPPGDKNPKNDERSKDQDQEPGDKDDQSDGDKKPSQPMPPWKKRLYWLGGAVLVVALIAGGVLYYLHARHYENTDDAFIDGHQSQVSAQVSAKVTRLAIQDNQQVKVGDPLLQLDPRDYQVRLDQARAQRAQAAAQLQQAQAGLLQQQAQVDQTAANVRVSEADLGQQQLDLARYRAIDPKAITRQQLDTSNAQTRSAGARLDASKQAVEAAKAQVEAQKAQIAAAAANLQAADATIENAELQLGYTTVLAPDSGRITRRTVEVGNYVNPGQSLLAVIPEVFWVTANFKETQLADMRPGQPVRIRVDACPGLDMPAHIDSFQTGTGAVFSSLPAENATGNYVKVVQRVPVKIVFDQKPDLGRCNLSLGLSVSPRVTVR